MISAGDFRNGITLEIDNAVYQIIEFQHPRSVLRYSTMASRRMQALFYFFCEGMIVR